MEVVDAPSMDSEKVEVGDAANCLYHAMAVALQEAGVGDGVGWHRIRQEVRVLFNLKEGVCKVVLQKSTHPQIHPLILYCYNMKNTLTHLCGN